jgi:hypothetical protein
MKLHHCVAFPTDDADTIIYSACYSLSSAICVKIFLGNSVYVAGLVV